MITPPMNGCFCDECMIEYFQQGMIMEGTAAFEDVVKILDERGLTYKKKVGYTPYIYKKEWVNEDAEGYCYGYYHEGSRT